MVLSQSQILERLTEGARIGASEYANAYVELFPEILKINENRNAFLGHVKSSADEARNAVKINLLYNETCNLDLTATNQMVLIWLAEKGVERMMGTKELQLRVTDPQPDFLAACEKGQVALAFGQPSDDATLQLLSDCAPLIEKGLVLPRPGRAIFYDTGVVNEQGGRNFTGLSVKGESLHDLWLMGPEAEDVCEQTVTSTILDGIYGVESEQARLCDVTLPYLDGVSMSDYDKILADEGDLLSEFRKEMRQLVSVLSKGQSSVDEFRADVIAPRVDKIGRRFKHIANLSRLKVSGATLASTSLTMVAVAQGGPLAGLGVAAGSMGVWAVLKELAERSDKVHSLKDDPLYLLWRLQSKR
jgi:hypothetical protein